MKQSGKKILALTLALALIYTMMPAPVKTEGETANGTAYSYENEFFKLSGVYAATATTSGAITVTNGTPSSATVAAGDSHTIHADTAPSGKQFKEWKFTPSNVDIRYGDKTTQSVTLRMSNPPVDITAEAVYEEISSSNYHAINLQTDGHGTVVARRTSNNNAVTSARSGNRIELDVDPHNGYYLYRWEVSPSTLSISSDYEFTMPDRAVIIKAIFRQGDGEYRVRVSGSNSSNDGAGYYEPDDSVTIRAGTRNNYRFDGWTSSYSGVNFNNRNSATTSFRMPSRDVTVTAHWEYTGGGSGGYYDPYYDPYYNPYYDYNTFGSAALTSTQASYDANRGGGVSVTVNNGSYNLSGVRNGSFTLVPGVDYTVSGNTYTLTDAYLATLPVGQHVFVFDMSGGTDPRFTVTVTGRAAETQPAPVPPTAQPTAVPVTEEPYPTPPPVAPSEPQFVVLSPFSDVSVNHPNFNEIMFVFSNGLMNGTSTQGFVFSPDEELSRGMIVTLLYRMYGSPDVTGLNNPFRDAAEGAWYTDAIKWASANGIVTGAGNNLYGVDYSISHQDLIVILARFREFAGLSLPTTGIGRTFLDDSEIADYARQAVTEFSAAGIIGATPVNSFLAPSAPATRAEVAVMLTKFLQATNPQTPNPNYGPGMQW